MTPAGEHGVAVARSRIDHENAAELSDRAARQK